MDETKRQDFGVTRETTIEDLQDLPPEFCHYQDEGCHLAKSCLECPFRRCVYERRGGSQRWLLKRQGRQIARLYLLRKKKARELAAKYGVSLRTVFRMVKEARPSYSADNGEPRRSTTGDRRRRTSRQDRESP